jgi:glycosyltransferase involved in cell wall biosynthesis
MFGIRPSIKIVATILAKNEEDIIGQNIEHHIEQGVSQFIVTDNNSSDRTRQIVERYPEVVQIIDEPEEDHNQTKWVTRMAKQACRLQPDWIVHLDADELCCNLYNLRRIQSSVVACECLYLHPPHEDMRYYLDFDHIPIPQECKVAHRPDPTFVITHGNHGVEGIEAEHTRLIPRHHYPIRSYEQWVRKAKGHLALERRNSPCTRWEKWYNLLAKGKLEEEYKRLLQLWSEWTQNPEAHTNFIEILQFWATPEMTEFFKNNPEMIPMIKEWGGYNAKQSRVD